MPEGDAPGLQVSPQDCVNCVNLSRPKTGFLARQLRTNRPGRAPVSVSFSRIITPLQKVAA